MSSLHCPYCEIKEASKTKEVFEAIQPIDGKCPDCGAYIDAGQYSVKVNSYKEIYEGAIKLMQDMVDCFNGILEYLDINLEDYFDNDSIEYSISQERIVENLFVSHYGGTTQSNFCRTLGIGSEYIDFEIRRENYE